MCWIYEAPWDQIGSTFVFLSITVHLSWLWAPTSRQLNLLDDPGSLLRLVRFDHMNYWYLKSDPPLPTFTPTPPFSKSPERSDNQFWFVLLDWSLRNTAWDPSDPKINAALSNHVGDPAGVCWSEGCCVNMDATVGCGSMWSHYWKQNSRLGMVFTPWSHC